MTDKYRQIPVYLPQDIYAALERMARDEDRSVSGVVRRLLKKALEDGNE